MGETRRGWGSSGEANEGLERLVWNNEIPFEMKAVRAMPDGFEIEFTKAADRKTAEDLASYSVESFIYKYHPVYGSPPVNIEKCSVRGIKLSDNGVRARIVVDNLRPAYIHTITLEGIREKTSGDPLLHPTAYYTLNNIPDGKKLAANELTASASKQPQSFTAKNDAVTSTSAKQVPKQTPSKVPGFFEVKSLLVNYTCTACHTTRNKQIGPGYIEIAQRNYTNEEIVQLIHQPKPENWPDYETAMPPMPHVTNEDALKIAGWINSLDEQ